MNRLPPMPDWIESMLPQAIERYAVDVGGEKLVVSLTRPKVSPPVPKGGSGFGKWVFSEPVGTVCAP